jgi:hypothetical protein
MTLQVAGASPREVHLSALLVSARCALEVIERAGLHKLLEAHDRETFDGALEALRQDPPSGP